MSAYKMTRLESIKTNARRIVELLNKHKIFSKDVEVEFKKDDDKSSNFILYFSLNDENYSDTLYFIKDETGSISGKVLGVYSSVGNKVGSFLLQLQLLLMFISNVPYLDLDNFTNDPARAARGVYNDFSVKKKGSPENWKGKDLAEQLNMSNGEMIYKPTAESRKNVEQKMRDIVGEQKAKGQPLPFWNNYDNIDKFIRDLHQTLGGKKHRQQSRRKRRSRNIKKKRSTRRYRK